MASRLGLVGSRSSRSCAERQSAAKSPIATGADTSESMRASRLEELERATGFEPATYGLGSRRSTPELHPHNIVNLTTYDALMVRIGPDGTARTVHARCRTSIK